MPPTCPIIPAGMNLRSQIGSLVEVCEHDVDAIPGGVCSQILAAVQPDRPNVILRGSESETRKLDSVPPGEPVAITGAIHEGRQNALVEKIEIGPGDKAADKEQ